jgi:thymidylate synthase ThyX
LFEAKIIADSRNTFGVRLTTFVVTFPRIILAEFNTHRVFSRNSASSRAIPVTKTISMVLSEPFIPTHFGKNQRGMQAQQEVGERTKDIARDTWIAAAYSAVEYATRLNDLGIHKQVVNRLLEPFMWHTVVVTATEWSNFFALRNNPMAQPEMQILASMMQKAYDASVPRSLDLYEWHLPFNDDDCDNPMVCAARCARVSYLRHDDARNEEADMALASKLFEDGHMSPFEHVAMAFTEDAAPSNFGKGWRQLRKTFSNEHDFSLRPS